MAARASALHTSSAVEEHEARVAQHKEHLEAARRAENEAREAALEAEGEASKARRAETLARKAAHAYTRTPSPDMGS